MVELLVVISIISVLAALLLPALQKALESGRTVACASNIKQVSLCLNYYTEDNDDWIPDAWCWWREDAPSSWYGATLYCDTGMGIYADTKLFQSCPSARLDKSKYYGINEYIGTTGFGGSAWPPKKPDKRINQVQNPTYTIAFIDGHPTKDSWVARPLLLPMVASFTRRYAWERHDGMPNMVHIDGHCSRKVPEDLDIYLWTDPSVKFWKTQ